MREALTLSDRAREARGHFGHVPVSVLTEEQSYLEMRRLRERLRAQDACEFADITDPRSRRTLCRETGECGCFDMRQRLHLIEERLTGASR